MSERGSPAQASVAGPALPAGPHEDPARIPSPRLERLLRPVNPAPLDAGAGDGRRWEWVRAGDWRLPVRPRTGRDAAGAVVESFQLESGATVDALKLSEDGRVFVPFDFDEAYGNYVTEAWREAGDVRALSDSQLGLYMRVKPLLPREFWLTLRRLFIRLGKPPEFPAWPLERGVVGLLRFYALCQLLAADVEEAPFHWFWPQSYRAAVILTHDVEGKEGLRLALELADLEQERGFRSSFNVVAAQYEIDYGILRELRERGFEIGVHGLRHDRSLFSSREEFERQLPGLAEAAQRFGADGFRSPSTYRVVEWLPELPVAYDCTMSHSDPYEPQPGGCCSLWPFMIGRIVELPYTLPQDHTMFTLLRKRAEPWLQQARAIEERFGLIQCLSHPDRGYLGDPDKRAFYVELLDALAEREGLWRALPRDVADWWRRREAGETDQPEQRLGTMLMGEAPEYASFRPPPAEPFAPTGA